MAYEQNGFNGTGPIHFTNVRILDCDRRISLHGRGSHPGQPHQAGDARLFAARRRLERDAWRRDRDRRHGRDADAGPDRRAPASVVEQRAGHRPDPDDGAGRAHARHHGDGEARARRRLHRRTRRGGGKAAARRRRQAVHQRRHASPARAISPRVRRSLRSAGSAIRRRRTFRTRASTSASSCRGPRKCAAPFVSSSNTASIPSSSTSPARRSPAWAPKRRRCRKRRWRWR